MPQNPYIPARDTDFDPWFQNFSALITATPTAFGLVAGDATTIAAGYNDWHDAYVLATDPTTRTSPTIAAKDSQRILQTAMIRPYATGISRNPAVTNDNKIAVGVSLPNSARTPIPPPTTVPGLTLVSAIHFLHTLAYRDTSTPTSKRKPYGVIGLDLWRVIATTAATDPNLGTPFGTVTKSPTPIGYNADQVGKTVTYFGRWVTRSGPSGIAQYGPWGSPLAVTVI